MNLSAGSHDLLMTNGKPNTLCAHPWSWRCDEPYFSHFVFIYTDVYSYASIILGRVYEIEILRVERHSYKEDTRRRRGRGCKIYLDENT